jgi:phosphoribosylanthranilate isomerase
MIGIKICGIKDLAAMDAALDAHVDFVGLVFFPASPRAVTLVEGAKLAEKARGRALVTALLVDADDALIGDIIAQVKPDLLQLHGKESVERVTAVRAHFGKPVMKAIAVECAEDLRSLADYESVVDKILFDAKSPKDANRPGGHGRSFDWRLLSKVSRKKPIMLSGGLAPENVADAIRIVHPDAVDVSSGVERAPGEKDPEKIKAFAANARAAAKNLLREKVS